MINVVDRRKDVVITCPHCGREYLPAEIYVPNAFFGHPEDIDRNDSGKVEFYSGPGMDLTETYDCDCGKSFRVVARVDFKSTPTEDSTFEEIYTSTLHSNRISLFEGISDDNN